MKGIIPFSRRTLFWIIFILGLMCILIDSAFLLLLDEASKRILAMSQAHSDSPPMMQLISDAVFYIDYLRVWFVPASAALFSLFGFILWFCLRISFGRLDMFKQEIPEEEVKSVQQTETSAESKKKKARVNKQFFLHLLSVLQKEGRLMDFFAEDLDDYDDEQIGGAVRSIHENCKKALDKYMLMDSVVEEEEDEEITIPKGFDPGAVKLTGNVTGEPPFTGTVIHRGWKVKKIELPTLSESRNPDIIAPAEVEIE